MLLQAISEAVGRQVSAQATIPSKVKGAVAAVTSVSILGSGFERKSGGRPRPEASLTVWTDTLRALKGLPLLCLCVDDAELLGKDDVGILKTIVEAETAVPVFLAVAGGPQLMERLSTSGTSPILRAFSGVVFDIGQFDTAETAEALAAPIKRRRGAGRWEEEAIERIQHLTRGYPYLVQCFAAAAYHEGSPINRQEVDQSIPQALRLASSWLERELPRSSDEDIRAFAKIANLGVTSFRNADSTRLGINHVYLGRLVAQGVLKRLSRGHYELRMAPAIAYFHALRRGLDSS